ncbi:KDGP aldolase [Enterococcus xiangfangensis]|uniref:KDGP aldolase n=1 Tax=Enterococcus xiangfangensis TaxID=1296537 RepID=UPI003D1631B6
MTISYEKFGLKEVINASGKMTILGVSKVSENVLAAQRFGGEHFFEMSELHVQTVVSRISGKLQPQHVNQVFTGIGASRALLGQNDTIINGLVSPCGKVGYVNIATGPLSSQSPEAIVPIETAIALLKDMGGSSVKYFPMKGLAHKEEYEAVAKACAEHDFYLEPTGGIDLENFQEIVKIALDAGVKKVIPHVYSSIIDAETGDTRPEDVKTLFNKVKELL